jgi:hypothetical protein
MRRYDCKRCSFSCSTRLLLNRHFSAEHNCSFCGYEKHPNACVVDHPELQKKEDLTFAEWWDEEIRLAQIHLGTGDYWASKGIAEKAWNAAKGIINSQPSPDLHLWSDEHVAELKRKGIIVETHEFQSDDDKDDIPW